MSARTPVDLVEHWETVHERVGPRGGSWYQAEPRLVGGDFIHPMPAGARIVGNLLYQALFDSYNQYKVRRMQEKFAKLKEGGANPFIDPASCTLEADVQEAMFHALLAEQQKAARP